MVRKAPLHREQLAVLAALALLTAAAWALTLTQMQSMAAMGGAPSSTDHGAMAGQPGMDGIQETSDHPEIGVQLFLFLGMWVTMMAAMMLPSAAPMILLFGTVNRRKRERGGSFVPTWIFVAGYLGVWTAFGAYAFGMSFVGADLARGNPVLGQLGPQVAAVAMLAAGLYQFTPQATVPLALPLAARLHYGALATRNSWRPPHGHPARRLLRGLLLGPLHSPGGGWPGQHSVDGSCHPNHPR
jgi:predicted metal-binding membrane protein